MAWHAQAVYGLGAPAYASDGNYYESLVAGNSGNNPASTTGFWRYCGPSFFTGHEPGDGKLVWHNNTPPAGWLKCNGAILLRASYQRLFAAIGTAHNIGGETSLQFRLPDTRGEFIRGFDDGRGADPGRVFGSFQNFEIQQHDHAGVPLRVDDTDRGTGPASLFSIDLMGSTLPTGGTETRPRNKTANYWIKY
ncbi:tail fiber protein [Pseudomonas sp. Y24-6]|nr:tail fiber protein [Pseudomonas sp. Y24-6]